VPSQLLCRYEHVFSELLRCCFWAVRPDCGTVMGAHVLCAQVEALFEDTSLRDEQLNKIWAG
jgi:hypothetical protein